MNLVDRITVDPSQCGGRPCIRGMRIRVSDILDLLANDLTSQQLLKELPGLELEDIHACVIAKLLMTGCIDMNVDQRKRLEPVSKPDFE